ncbi:pyocin knob domain-containing S74 family peptidase [Escherichia coli]|uniref:pyocin knob domain-containing S74 family peptidase n=1 Tax=Escherichia coli TaxID=562 RepID=UPI002283C8B2|nr:pyocin knob domain-containing S74 family peptidase [Escherichia coli]MCZ0611713.1 pyocin knob domain-containing S74 family peptidase [Escherichia coli]
MIYTTGTIAINGNTVTGTGTNFSEPLSLIRVGCTLIAISNPVQIFTITEIKSGTELSVTPAANPAIAAGTKFSILLSDSISVDGLAQDVAETLRYYQGKETEIASAVEWWNEFGGDGQMEQLLADIRTETAKSTANAQKTESDKNAAAASKTAAANSATAAKASQDAAKASETAASNSKTAAATSETNAAKSAADALNYRNQAQAITGSDIGLGSVPRDCPDISGNPSGYIGFMRIMSTATGFPSIASGESSLTGFISQVDGSPSYTGIFQGWNSRSVYTYRWAANIGPQWTRHARKDEVSRLYNYTVETQLYAGESTNYLFISNSAWGARTESGPLHLGLNYGGTGGGNAGQARTNLEAMHEKKSDLGSTNINTLTGEYSGFYYQGLNANATTERGYPVSSSGALLVIRNNANGNAGCTQLYFPYSATNGAFYMRQHLIQSSSSGWGWSAWKKFQSLDVADSPQFKSLNLVVSSDAATTAGGILQNILNDASGAQRARSRFYPEFRSDGKSWATIHLQGGDKHQYAGLSEDGDFALSTGDFVGRSARLTSNVNAPLTLQSTHPTIKFDETDRPEGAPDYAFIVDGGSWRIEKDHWGTSSGRNCIRYDLTNDEIVVPNLNVSNSNSKLKRIFSYDSAFSKRLSINTSGTTSKDAEIYLWGGGESSRPTVLEFKLKEPGTDTTYKWLFYSQLNTDESVQLDVNGAVNCTTVNQSSDRDLKDNIQVIGDATEAIRKMNGYTYTLKENGLPYAGVIAQEVMEALPEAVGSFTHYGKELQGPTIDGNELREETRYLNVDYAAVTGLLVQVARETDNRVTELEEENASLRANIAVMDERIAKLEALVSKLTEGGK